MDDDRDFKDAYGDDFGSDFVTITDDEGNSYELEKLSEDDIEVDGRAYRAFLPVPENENEENYEMILFRVVEEDGEEFLETIDDEAEMEKVYETFMDILFGEDDE